nr:Golgi to ER traffic protein 4 homolog isoform X2 [Arachis hypogaea]
MYVETLVKGKIPYDEKTLDLVKKIYQAFPRVPLPQHLWDVDDVQQLSEDIGTAKARVEGCSSFLKAAIRWSAEYGADSNGSPELHIMLAEYIYSESPEADIGKVTYHFTRGNDPKKFASTLVNFLGKCYPGEDDLAIARAVLRFLCQGNLRDANLLVEEVKTQIESTEIEFPKSELMQFITYLLQTMERDALPLFNMLRVNYKSSIDREPAFHEMLDDIAEKFFGVQRRNPMGMFGDIFKLMGSAE